MAKEKMKVIYSDEPALDVHVEKSIFLAGPTPRSKDIKSWRPDALKILEDLKYDGTVCVPERSNWEGVDYITQVEWEYSCLSKCNTIVFWVPREINYMPAFTTNVEFGYWLATEACTGYYKVIYGRPDWAENTRYLDWLYRKSVLREPLFTLEDTLKVAIL